MVSTCVVHERGVILSHLAGAKRAKRSPSPQNAMLRRHFTTPTPLERKRAKARHNTNKQVEKNCLGRFKKKKKERKKTRRGIWAYQFENNKEEVVDDKRPFASVAITGNTKDGGTDRSEHEHQGDAPCNVRVCLAKLLGQVSDGERDGKEVKGIPGLEQARNYVSTWSLVEWEGG